MTRPLIALSVLLVVLVSCTGPPAGTTPLDADAAAGRVLASDARFAGIGPRDPGLIGQADWYEVSEADGGWRVRVRIGWGDCPAGCIHEHTWTFAVSGSGDVELVAEGGDPMPAVGHLQGVATAGPVCPVERIPPDPACADRPVPGATLILRDPDGREVARTLTDANGRFGFDAPAGTYLLEPQPVEGLMGTASAVEVNIQVGETPADWVVSYDTGIR